MKPQDHVKTNNRPVQINQLINLFPDIDFISLIFCFLKHVCFSLEIPPVKFSCESRDLWLSHHTLDLVAHKQTYLITKFFLRLKFDKLNTVVKMYSCYVCATDPRPLTDLIFRAKLLLMLPYKSVVETLERFCLFDMFILANLTHSRMHRYKVNFWKT